MRKLFKLLAVTVALGVAAQKIKASQENARSWEEATDKIS